MQALKYKVTCPRWALPAEEVPIHVQFDKALTPLLQSANVALHESLVFKDFINLTDHECDGRHLAVNSIGRFATSGYDYFGFAVATKAPFRELKRMVPVEIRFNYRDGRSETCTEHVRIFRPLLELGASPSQITITDGNAGRLELPIAMKFSGFGQIKVSAECRIGGRIVSFASSMLGETMRKIAKDGMVPAEVSAGAGTGAGPGCVERTAAETSAPFQGRGEPGRIPGLHGGAHADALHGTSQGSRERLAGIPYSAAGAYAGQAIAEMLDRNVGANLEMEPTRIHAQISLPVTRVAVRLLYKDLAGNNYSPVEKQVEIVDRRRSSAGLDVEMPLCIKSVDESMAYKNVSAMEIDAGG